MKHAENTSLYLADEGKTFVRKDDAFVMGTGIDLGINDSIENYEEVELTEENDIEGKLKQKDMYPKTQNRVHIKSEISAICKQS